jgi:hypothetical protein
MGKEKDEPGAQKNKQRHLWLLQADQRHFATKKRI